MSNIVSVWQHDEDLGLLFVSDESYDAPDTIRHDPAYVVAWWIDAAYNFVARVPAFRDGQPRNACSRRVDTD